MRLNYVKRAVFLGGIALILYQQLPQIKDNYYELIRTCIYVLFGILALIAAFDVFVIRKWRPRVINVFALAIMAIAIEFGILSIIHVDIQITDIVELLVPFGLLVISYDLHFTNNATILLSKAYAVSILTVAIIQIYYYAGGFVIREQYVVMGKNSMGPFVAVAAGITFYFALEKFKNRELYRSIIWIAGLAFSVSVLIIMRSRAALVSVVILMAVMINKSKGIGRKLVAPIALIVLLSITSSEFLKTVADPVQESLFLSYNSRDVDSLSGGRFSVYRDAAEIVLRHPFLGEATEKQKAAPIPHNYLLNKAKKYGLCGGVFFFAIYFYLFFFIIRRILKFKTVSFKTLPIYLSLIPFIVSLFEYQYPYGPGTTQMFIYFLLGQFLLVKQEARDGNQRLVPHLGIENPLTTEVGLSSPYEKRRTRIGK